MLILCAPLAQASSLNEFFNKLEGSWELTSGSMTLYSASGEATKVLLSKLSTVDSATEPGQWRFDETYCTLDQESESCFDTTYFYKLVQDKLFLITPEGSTELNVVAGSANVLGFMILSETTSSLTFCSFNSDSEMFQEGAAYNADGSSSSQAILIHKIKD